MGCRSNARRRHVDPTRIGVRISDELRNRLGGERRIHLHDEGRANNAPDGRDVADEIKIQLVIERRIYCVRRPNQEESIAIWRGTYGRLGGAIAPRAWPVLDDELLT